jgi:TonB-dependent starch-binding outer membrane protein SusC
MITKYLSFNKQGLQNPIPIRLVTILLVMVLIHYPLLMQSMATNVLQSKIVTGTISDAMSGESLVGVNIAIKGTTTGTVSDVNGNFSLEIPDQETNLRITYIGYLSEEVAVMPGMDVKIELVPSIEMLEGVVVMGYGTQKERNVTGSVSHMRSDDIREMAVTSIDQTMQGRLAGVVITQNSSAPGGSVTVRVRGATSGTSNEPLYVIDGVPIYNDNNLSAVLSPSGGGQPQNVLASLNPSDIESITVLKDASATSIYGSRGANGVVLITTRRGQAGQTRVSFETYVGLQQISKRYDLLNAGQFASLSREAALNSGLRVYLGTDEYFTEIPPFIDPGMVEQRLGEGTNWQDQILQTAPMQNYQLSISSGTERGNYALMAGVFDQQGIIKGSDFSRYSMRLNTNYKVSDRIGFGSSVALARSLSNLIPSDGIEGSGAIIAPALSYLPVIQPRREDGSLSVGVPGYFANVRNPMIPIELNEMNTTNNRVIGNMFAEVSLLENLTYKMNAGFDYNDNKGNLFTPVLTREGFDPANSGRSQMTIVENMWLLENTLNYAVGLGNNHNLDVLAGYSAQEFHREFTYISKRNFSNIDNNTLNNALEVDGASGGLFSEYALLSMFGRINYNYAEKYLTSFTLRRDGSSRFGKDNRYGIFPAFSLGWRLSDEQFLSNVSSLSNLMIRYSFGISGNQEISNYAATAQTAIPEVGYGFGRNTPQMGTWPLSIPNDALSWEETAQGNLGIDVGLLNDRFEITLDYYRKKTSGVLVYMNPPILAGYSESYWENAGIIENQGLELLFSGRLISTPNFRWLSDLNFALNENTVVSFPGADEGFILESTANGRAGQTYLFNGQPLGNFYGYKTDGVFLNQQEVDAHVNSAGDPIQPNAQPGDIRYVDKDGDGTITSNDRTVIGNAMPKLTLGFTNRITWKQFELSAFIYVQTGNDVFNATRYYLEGMLGDRNQTASTLNRWVSESEPGDGKTPRATRLDPNQNWRFYSDRWIEDGSFVRLRNLTFSYSLPDSWIKNLDISRCRLSVTGQNLFTLTNYTGFDPEVSSNAQSAYFPGYDLGAYPLARSVIFNISVIF